MEIALILVAAGILCIGSLVIGVNVGMSVNRGEDIHLPTVKTPMEAYRQHEAKKEAQKEQDRMETIMRNIENYDGTSNGQEDVPRG